MGIAWRSTQTNVMSRGITATAHGRSTVRRSQLFLERVQQRPDQIAFRYKDLGLYQEVSWKRYFDEVQAFSLGLAALGAERGDRIAIMGDPCFEYFIADMAGLCLGATTYGIYTTCSPLRSSPPAGECGC